MDINLKEELESLRREVSYIKEYIDKKYERMCNNILEDTSNTFYSGICFSTFFDKLFFVFQYEEGKYKSFLEEQIRPMVYEYLSKCDTSEVDLLFSRCIRMLSEEELRTSYDNQNRNHYLIASEIIEIADGMILERVPDVFLPDMKSYVNELVSDIENFAYDGSMDGEDYDINSYWEEFCFQLQYGYGQVLEIILADIDSHLTYKLKKAPMKEIISLFTTTEEYIYGYYSDSSIHEFLQIYTKNEMIDFIVEKLIDEIKSIAANTPTLDFSSGETWDD